MGPSDDPEFEHRIEGENYFVSMTDMMVGLVFIFIILLMYYALQLQQAQAVFHQTTQDITSANQTRAAILEDVQRRLRDMGLRVEIDTANGVLRLPDEILFDSGRAEITPKGRDALTALGIALNAVLPCYTDRTNGVPPPNSCGASRRHHIESLFIEGHTDADRLTGYGQFRDNWDLSVTRATNTYRELIRVEPDLLGMCMQKDGQCIPILSVSGYGEKRPAAQGDDPQSKAKNRRIDLRILMEAPRVRDVQRDLDKKLGEQH